VKQRKVGVAAMLQAACWFDSTVGMEVLNIGKSATGREDCGMEICGSQLLVRVTLQGGWVWLGACGLDEGAPEAICNFPDTSQGWTELRKLVRALEISGIRSLQPRPIRIGETGAGAYTID
jgi:hypothetical protein